MRRSVALTSTDCVASSARGAMNVTGFEAITCPSLSSSSTIRPGSRSVAALERHVDVRLEPLRLIDRRDQRRPA